MTQQTWNTHTHSGTADEPANTWQCSFFFFFSLKINFFIKDPSPSFLHIRSVLSPKLHNIRPPRPITHSIEPRHDSAITNRERGKLMALLALRPQVSYQARSDRPSFFFFSKTCTETDSGVVDSFQAFQFHQPEHTNIHFTVVVICSHATKKFGLRKKKKKKL